MLILTWVGIIFVKILHLAIARCKIMTNIMPTHVKLSIIEPGIRELFLKQWSTKHFPDKLVYLHTNVWCLFTFVEHCDVNNYISLFFVTIKLLYIRLTKKTQIDIQLDKTKHTWFWLRLCSIQFYKKSLKIPNGEIRIRNSEKDRQHNGQKKDRQHNGQKKDRQHNGQKKDRQHNGQKKKDKRINNNLQNTKVRARWTSL